MNSELEELRKEVAAMGDYIVKLQQETLSLMRLHRENDDLRTKEILDINQCICEINESLRPLVDKVFPEFAPGSDTLAALLERQKPSGTQ